MLIWNSFFKLLTLPGKIHPSGNRFSCLPRSVSKFLGPILLYWDSFLYWSLVCKLVIWGARWDLRVTVSADLVDLPICSEVWEPRGQHCSCHHLSWLQTINFFILECNDLPISKIHQQEKVNLHLAYVPPLTISRERISVINLTRWWDTAAASLPEKGPKHGNQGNNSSMPWSKWSIWCILTLMGRQILIPSAQEKFHKDF